MPFGWKSRRLPSSLFAFLIVSVLLFYTTLHQLRPRLSTPQPELLTASEELLRTWEAPKEQQTFNSWEDSSFEGIGSNSLGRQGRDSSLCQPLRPREETGHVTAYLIMVHSEETLEGARLLLEQIYDPLDLFLIHVDAKLNGTRLWETVNGMEVCENVEFVPHSDRVDIKWGDISMVDAEIKMLKRAIRSPIPWTNAIFLDGTSWPILDAVARQDWFNVFEEEVRTDGEGPLPPPICRWKEEPIENESECWRTAARCMNRDCSKMSNTPRNQPVRKGDQWTVLTREMAKYSIFGQEAQDWYNFFRDSAVPDEHFFATLKYAQPGAPTGWLRIPMYVDWTQPCKSNPVEFFTGHPCSLGMNDFNDIEASVAMYARKVPLNETELRSSMLRGEVKAILFPPIPI
ncbi:hypothetical protein JCM3765_001341 [Sporobolomyces pararoseus]